jgi:putative transposase
MLPVRKALPHEIPAWAGNGALFFITLCATPRGDNQLCHPDIAVWLLDSLAFRERRGDWRISLVLLMPDHLHALMAFPPTPGMKASLTSWKHFTSRIRNIQWQRDFFEHRLRNDENVIEKSHYIRMNPVRAGLIDKPESWPYVWSPSAVAR